MVTGLWGTVAIRIGVPGRVRVPGPAGPGRMASRLCNSVSRYLDWAKPRDKNRGVFSS